MSLGLEGDGALPLPGGELREHPGLGGAGEDAGLAFALPCHYRPARNLQDSEVCSLSAGTTRVPGDVERVAVDDRVADALVVLLVENRRRVSAADRVGARPPRLPTELLEP